MESYVIPLLIDSMVEIEKGDYTSFVLDEVRKDT